MGMRTVVIGTETVLVAREVPRSLYMKTVVGPMKTVFVGKTVHLAAGSSFRKIKSRIAKRFTKGAYLC